MSNGPMKSTYCEPTVMWRMRHRDGRLAHALVLPRGHGAAVIWFLNGRPLGSRDCDDWAHAIQWSDQMRAQFWTVGWRLASDADDGPITRGEVDSANRH